MFGIKVIFLIGAILISCNSAYNIKNHDSKCDLDDLDCQKNLYNKVIQELSETGLPEAGVPPFDPFEVKNSEVVLMGMIKLAMPEGIVKGFKTCRSESVRKDTEKLIASMDIACEALSIEGKYKIETTPTLDALIGGIKVHGEGQGGVKIEDLKITLEIPFKIKQLDDSELHYVIIKEKLAYTVQSVGNLVIHGDNMYVGSQEISSVVVNIFNENWKFFVKTFGNTILDLTMEEAFKHINKFFAKVPLKDLLTGDLSPYVTN